jgi:hypothetical protein
MAAPGRRGGPSRQQALYSSADTLSRQAHGLPHPAHSLCASVHMAYMAPTWPGGAQAGGLRRGLRSVRCRTEVCLCLSNIFVKDRQRLQRPTMVAGKPEATSAVRQQPTERVKDKVRRTEEGAASAQREQARMLRRHD